MNLQLISSSPNAQWVVSNVVVDETDASPSVWTDGVVTDNFKGFGGCFNELGWRALGHLDETDRLEILHALFSADGCGFNYNRMPIGANDFSETWYSHNETAGDYAMDNFSIGRDHQSLIPYIRAARETHGKDFFLFASPWSPPTWMKFPSAYNYGTLIWEPQNRQAYAKYFVRFVDAYADEGIRIDAVHVQNEPNSDQKFPSCLWTGAQMRDFIRDDLGPAFESTGTATQIWAGTIERGDFNSWAGTILSDAETARFVSGLGFQWAGKYGVQRTRQAFPKTPLIQTECECGDGSNSWEYAHYVFDLIQHYLSNGAEAYVYWNMVLETGGLSTWGWRQNSMVTVDSARRTATFNPEFYVMKHFAGIVKPGAQVLRAVGPLAANTLAFRNPDGRQVFVLQNPHEEERTVAIQGDAGSVSLTLGPRSISTCVM